MHDLKYRADLPNIDHFDYTTSSALRVEPYGKVKIHFTNLQPRFKQPIL